MINEEIRLKIATIKGILPYPKDRCPVCGWPIGEKDSDCHIGDCCMRPQPKPRADEQYPNWPVDIAAAWELEEEIPQECRDIYTAELDKIVHENFKPYYPSKWDLLHASPRDRCLAYIAWKEGQNG